MSASSAVNGQLKIDPKTVIDNAKDVVCECGSKVFQQGLMLKELSEIVSPTGKVIIIPIEIMFCHGCGKTLERKPKI